jgi:hypothetical protein
VKLRADGTPWIFSWAHGSCEYALKQHCMPIINLRPGEIECIVDQAESALIAAGHGLHQRDGLIVSVGEVKIITADEKEILAQRAVRCPRLLPSRWWRSLRRYCSSWLSPVTKLPDNLSLASAAA